jgi:hypothetical protein
MPKENQVSRRTFLKTTGAAGAGILAAGLGTGTLLHTGKAHGKGPPVERLGYLPYDNTIDPDEVRKLAWKHYFLNHS